VSIRLTAVSAALLVALAPIACGGDEGDDYKEEFPAVSQKIVSLGEQVGDAIETAAESTDQELARDFDDFADDLAELRKQLDELEPPEDLAEEHDDLLAAMAAVRRSLGEIADAAGESDAVAARDATVQFVERSNDLREARRTLARAVSEQD
jgi:hypothetical protein